MEKKFCWATVKEIWFISSICQSPCRMVITFQNTRLFWVSLCFIRHSSVSFASSSFSSWSLDHSVPQGSVIHTFLYQWTLSPWWSHPVSCYYIPSICWQFPDLYFLDFSPELQTYIYCPLDIPTYMSKTHLKLYMFNGTFLVFLPKNIPLMAFFISVDGSSVHPLKP